MKTQYLSTIGLMASHEKFTRPKLVKVWFSNNWDGTVKATVEMARNGCQIDSLGKKTITEQELADMPSDDYDESVFALAAFKLFELKAK